VAAEQDGSLRRFGPWRHELGAFAELFAIAGLAVAQPMFDVAGKNAEIFATRRASASELFLFTLAVMLVPPVALYVVEVLGALVWPAGRRFVHAALVGVAAGVFVEEAVKHATELGAVALIVVGTIGGLGVAVLRLRIGVVRSFLRVLAVAPVAFALLFVAASPVTNVVFDQGGGQPADVRIEAPHRVVWIVFDEFPLTSLLDGTGHVDRALFPNFASLADSATWYRNSTTVAPFTAAAVPAMLTGKEPTSATTPAVPANFPHNVFTLLGGTYDMHVHETLTAMCPTGICRDARRGTVHRGVGSLLGSATDLWREFASPRRKPPGLDVIRGVMALDSTPGITAAHFVDGIRPAKGPRLDLMHVLLPHWPWHYRATLQDDGQQQGPGGLAGDRWVDQPWVTVAAKERHLLQVQATDTVLGMVRKRLEQVGGWDDSLVVVTADHGVGFEPGDPPRGLSTADLSDVVWTPLFVKYPGQAAGRVDDRPATTVDILPTVADVLHVRSPWKLDGTSLLHKSAADDPTHVFHWWIDKMVPKHGKFNVVDRATGFAKALTERASSAVGDPALRLYRTGPYGDLVGRSTTGLVDPGATSVRLSVQDRTRFAAVDPGAPSAPWLYVSGAATPARGGVPIAVSVNGVVGAVTETVPGASPSVVPWWASLPPQLFRAGANDVRFYEIVGPPDRARLHAFALAP
jgi:hypothetical protein